MSDSSGDEAGPPPPPPKSTPPTLAMPARSPAPDSGSKAKASVRPASTSRHTTNSSSRPEGASTTKHSSISTARTGSGRTKPSTASTLASTTTAKRTLPSAAPVAPRRASKTSALGTPKTNTEVANVAPAATMLAAMPTGAAVPEVLPDPVLNGGDPAQEAGEASPASPKGFKERKQRQSFKAFSVLDQDAKARQLAEAERVAAAKQKLELRSQAEEEHNVRQEALANQAKAKERFERTKRRSLVMPLNVDGSTSPQTAMLAELDSSLAALHDAVSPGTGQEAYPARPRWAKEQLESKATGMEPQQASAPAAEEVSKTPPSAADASPYDTFSFTVVKTSDGLGFSFMESEPGTPGTLVVKKLKASGAAAVAGMRVGDILVSVDGQPLHTCTKAEAMALLKNVSTTVQLEICRARRIRGRSIRRESNESTTVATASLAAAADARSLATSSASSFQRRQASFKRRVSLRQLSQGSAETSLVSSHSAIEGLPDDVSMSLPMAVEGAPVRATRAPSTDGKSAVPPSLSSWHRSRNISLSENRDDDLETESTYPDAPEALETTDAMVVQLVQPRQLRHLASLIGEPDHMLAGHDFLDTQLAELRLRISDMSLHDYAGFKREFQEISLVGRKNTATASLHPENLAKNRYNNIVAYDHSRVKLSVVDDDPESDYINANYIGGYQTDKDYITCQGPLPKTFSGFWRMVWECNVGVIVMLTKEVEGSKRKCHRYWPDPDSHPPQPQMRFDSLTVSHEDSKDYDAYTRRTFILAMGPSETARTVHQFCYRSWPDHGAPKSTHELLQFRHVVRECVQRHAIGGPLTIHCSAGVGRSGAFLAIDRLLQALDGYNTAGLDVFPVVADMRNARNLMVQSLVQYTFVYRALADAMEAALAAADTQAPAPLSDSYLDQSPTVVSAKAEAVTNHSSGKALALALLPLAIGTQLDSQEDESSSDSPPLQDLEPTTLSPSDSAVSLQLTAAEPSTPAPEALTAAASSQIKRVSIADEEYGFGVGGPGSFETLQECGEEPTVMEMRALAGLPAPEELRFTLLARWGVSHVVQWLEWQGFDEYVSAFQLQGVDGPGMLDLTDMQLDALGFEESTDRERLLAELKRLEEDPGCALLALRRPQRSRSSGGHDDRPSKETMVPASALTMCSDIAAVPVSSSVPACATLSVHPASNPVVRVYGSRLHPHIQYKSFLLTPRLTARHLLDEFLRLSHLLNINPAAYCLVLLNGRHNETTVADKAFVLPLLRTSGADMKLELRHRKPTSAAGTITIDTALISGMHNEISLPLRSDTSAAQVVASVLNMCGVLDGAAKFVLQEVYVDTAVQGKLLANSATPLVIQQAADMPMIFRLARRTKNASSALSEPDTPSDSEAWDCLQAERDQLWAEVQQGRLRAAELAQLQHEHAQLKEELAATGVEMAASAPASVLIDLRQQLAAAQATAVALDMQVRTHETSDGALETAQARIQVLEQSLTQFQSSAAKRERTERNLREKMEKAYVTKSREEDGRGPHLAALEVALDEKEKLMTAYKEENAAQAVTVHELLLTNAALRARVEGQLDSGEQSAGTMAMETEQVKLFADVLSLQDQVRQLKHDLAETRGTLAVQQTRWTLGSTLPNLHALVGDRTIVAVTLFRDGNKQLGLSLTSATKPRVGEMAGVYIKALKPNGVAALAGLWPGDQLLEVDGQTLLEASKDESYEVLKATGEIAYLVVARCGESAEQKAKVEAPRAKVLELEQAHSDILIQHNQKRGDTVATRNALDSDQTIARLAAELQETQMALKNLQQPAFTTAAAAQVASDVLTTQVQSLQEKVEEKNAMLESVGESVHATEQSLREAQSTIKDLHGQVTALQVRLKEKQQQTEAHHQRDDTAARLELTAEQERCSKLTTEVDHLKACQARQTKKAQVEAVASKRRFESVEEARAALQTEVDRLKGEEARWRKSLSRSNSSTQQRDMVVTDLQQRLKAAQAATQLAEEGQQATVASLNADLLQKTQIVAKLRAQLQENKADASDQLRQLQGQAAKFQTEVAQAKQAAAKEIADVSAEALKIKQREERLATELQARDTMLQAIQAERDHLAQTLRDQSERKEAAAPLNPAMQQKAQASVDAQWELLAGRTREEVADLLEEKEESLERMKSYVDLLTNIVIDRAPELLQEVNQRADKVVQRKRSARR